MNNGISGSHPKNAVQCNVMRVILALGGAFNNNQIKIVQKE